MTDRESFVAHLVDVPTDFIGHLVFADWLDEHDEPEEANRHRGFPAAYRRIQEIADSIDSEVGMTLCRLIEIAEIMVDHDYAHGESFSTGDRSVDSPFDLDDGATERFWKDWSIITGRPIPGHLKNEYGWGKPVSFYCAC